MTRADPETPLRLADILPLAFPAGGMTISGLRKEARRGRLAVMRIAGKDFTTLADIEEMKRQCRLPPNQQGSGSDPPARTERRSGSSSTGAGRSTLAAAELIVKRLSRR